MPKRAGPCSAPGPAVETAEAGSHGLAVLWALRPPRECGAQPPPTAAEDSAADTAGSPDHGLTRAGLIVKAPPVGGAQQRGTSPATGIRKKGTRNGSAEPLHGKEVLSACHTRPRNSPQPTRDPLPSVPATDLAPSFRRCSSVAQFGPLVPRSASSFPAFSLSEGKPPGALPTVCSSSAETHRPLLHKASLQATALAAPPPPAARAAGRRASRES